MGRGSIFWGLIVLLVGILLLLDNLGYLGNINIWSLIWPLFLIALGGWILWSYYSRDSIHAEHVVVPLMGAIRANLRLQHGAGRIEIFSGTSTENLMEGDFGGGLDINNYQRGDELDIKMKMPGGIFPFDWSPGQSLDWMVALSRELPLSLHLETGASEARLDLSELHVTELSLKSGASSTILTLPLNAGYTRVKVESGAASLKVIVPEGIAVRIRSSGGLSSISVSDRFPKTGNLYLSPDYDSAANKVEMDLEIGVGSVSIG